MCFWSHQADAVKATSPHTFPRAPGVLSNRACLIRGKQSGLLMFALKIRHMRVIVIYTHFDIF